MEYIYALGIDCIRFTQRSDEKMDWIMNIVDWTNSPHNVLEYIAPWACVLDHLFGAQIFFAVAFGTWANNMLKWMILEDRPYWWIRETSYYDDAIRPTVRQSTYTCDTSPGSPSGHCATACTVYLLSQLYTKRVLEEMGDTYFIDLFNWLPRKLFFCIVVFNACVARMLAGAHFPHQCLFGALLGTLLTPTVCVGIIDPLMSEANPRIVKKMMMKHFYMVVIACISAIFLGTCYWFLGVDIHWGTRLAFRWCENPANISVKSTPIFSTMQAVSYLLGCAIAVTPEVAKFRYNSPNRNNAFFVVATAIVPSLFHTVQLQIPPRRFPYYSLHFCLNVLKPYVYLRLLPKLSLFFTSDIPDHNEERHGVPAG